MKKPKQIKTKAFTLVELIVVITILAILGTIAFISLQGYSGEARDAKRGTDVRKMLTKLNLEQTSKGLGYKEMLKNSEMHNLIINGDDTAESYEGTINFELLKESPKNFRDPDTKVDYEFATANGTSNGETYNFIQGRYWSEKDNKEVILGNYYQFQKDDAINLFKGSIISQPIKLDGKCGNANNTNQTNEPAGELACKKGTKIDMTGTGPWSWICEGINGGTNTTTCKTNAYCATRPTGTNIQSFNDGIPTQNNQAWIQGTGACSYTCKANYFGINCAIFTPDYSGGAGTSTGQTTTNLECTGTDIIIKLGDSTGLIMAGCNSNVGKSSYNECTGNTNCQGRYYTWANAPTACPSPRRLPTQTELQKMISSLGWGDSSPMSSPYYLTLVGGYGSSYGGTDVGDAGLYWSSTGNSDLYAYFLVVYADTTTVNYYGTKTHFLGVRCVKD